MIVIRTIVLIALAVMFMGFFGPDDPAMRRAATIMWFAFWGGVICSTPSRKNRL